MNIVKDKQKIKCYGLYTPENLNLDTVLNSKLRPFGEYLVSLILWRTCQGEADKHGYVTLKIDYLRRAIPDRILPNLKKILLDLGIIQTDGYYITNRKSYGYRLGPSYRHQPVRRINCACPKLARTLVKLREEKARTLKLSVHKWLRRKIEHELDIDIQQAQPLCASDPNAFIAADAFAKKEFSFSVCPHGRFHSNLTRLPRDLRHCLRYKGQKLVNIDISNSQPLFLALLYLNSRNVQSDKKSKIIPFRSFKQTLQKCNTDSSFTQNLCVYNHISSITASNSLEDVTGYRVRRTNAQNRDLAKDEEHYLSLCEKGRLYNEMMEALEREDKDRFKEDFFTQVFFGTNHAKGEIKDLFKEWFPPIMAFVQQAKRKNHKQLSHRMQRDESKFMLNTVCQRLMEEMPEAPVYTIHDSILTTEEYADRIYAIILEEFSRFGIYPNLKREPC